MKGGVKEILVGVREGRKHFSRTVSFWEKKGEEPR